MLRTGCLGLLLGTMILPVEASAGSSAKIAFLAPGRDYWQAWVLEEGKEEPRQVTRSPGDKVRASWLPGGGELMVATLDGELLRVEAQSGKETPVALDVPCFDAAVAPDGRRIACSRPDSAEDPYNHSIWLIDLEGGEARQLTFRPGMEHEPAWHPEGTWIYYAAGSGGYTHDLWRVTPDGRRRERLSAGPRYWLDPSVAADGTLAYASNQTGGDYEIWVRPPEGPAKRLTQHPGLDAHPSLSPDGLRLVFERISRSTPELWLWEVSTGRERPLPGTRGGRRPSWWHPEVSAP